MSYVPGSNLLNQALSVIRSQAVDYYQFTGSTVNEIGMEVSTFLAPVTIFGSFQPIERSLYEQYGLDFSKTYANFYSSNDIIAVDRNVSGDEIVFESNRYKCQSNTEWFGIDGWNHILLVLI